MIILTEKPNVAEAIASALEGFVKDKNQRGLFVRGDDCIVSAQGHLLCLKEPQDYDPKFAKWNLEDLPINPESISYKPIEKNFFILKKISNCFRQFDSSEFILATDAEREGELIGAEILDYVNYHNSSSKRFWVSEALTPEVVRKGLANAKPLINYEKYRNEGMARQQADWLVGMNISRLISVSANTLCTFGRVQTAILGAIYLREKSIAEFVPTPYKQLEIILSKYNIDFKMYLSKNENNRFKENDSFFLQAANIIHSGSSLSISSVKKETKKENPPQLFNITGLQKYCSKKFKISPAETLDIAQKLYEEYKCLSYPRTPSVVLGDDNVQLYRDIYNKLKDIPESSGCNEKYIDSSYKHLFNSAKLQDHHGLIPLDFLPEKANEKERQVYSAVVKRFFNIIKEPFIYEQISFAGLSNNYQFEGSGRKIIQKGFKIKTEEEDTQELPDLQENENLTVKNVNVLDKLTQPKKHYTNTTILALMENPKGEDENIGKLAGLGTPATRADIIVKLLSREYIVQQGQTLLITEKGKFLIEAILKVPELKDFISIAKTTEWEEKLQNNPEGFLLEIKAFIASKIKSIKITDKWVDPGFGTCPVCRTGKIYDNQKSYYCSNYKNGCKFSVWKNICNAKINSNDIKLLLSGNKTKPKKMINKAGKEFSCPLVLTNGKVDFVFDKK